MALAHGDAVLLHDLAEQLEALRLSDLGHHAGEPFAVVGLDAEAALPARMGELFPGLGQLLFLHGLRVVGRRVDVHARADPFAVRSQRGRDQLAEMR